jgi:putative flippase GtrA
MKNLTFKLFLVGVVVLCTFLMINNLYLVVSIGMVVKFIIGVAVISILSYLIGYHECSKKHPEE